jgi:hypothetical protein
MRRLPRPLFALCSAAPLLLCVGTWVSFGCDRAADRPPSRAAGGQPTPRRNVTEHAVIVHLKLSGTDASADEVERLQNLSDRLSEAITGRNAGEFDGDLFGEGECVLYMYGPDADALFAAIEPVLRASP